MTYVNNQKEVIICREEMEPARLAKARAVEVDASQEWELAAEEDGGRIRIIVNVPIVGTEYRIKSVILVIKRNAPNVDRL